MIDLNLSAIVFKDLNNKSEEHKHKRKGKQPICWLKLVIQIKWTNL